MTRITIYRTLSPIVLALLNVACTTVGPDYERPTMDLPTTFKEAADTIKPQTGEASTNAHWWTIYGDHDLDQLMAQLELQNYTLRAAEARVRQARSVSEVARAGKYPTLTAGGKNDFGLLANWEIDLWGRIQRNIEASGAAAQASQADLAAVKLLLQAQLAQNYFLLRIQDTDIGLLQDTITSYQRSMKITRNQYAVGVVDRGNVVQAQSQLSTTQAKWYEARITRAKLEHSIATLIGKAPADFSLDSAPIDVQVPEVPLVLPATLLKRRPDIAAAERRMAAASAQIGVAEAEAYPALNLFAGASIRKGLLGGAKVNAPLYAGGAIQARGAEASAAYTEVVANYRQTVLDSFREVEDDLITLQHLDKASEAMTEAVKASRETVKIMKNQYHAGIINYQSIVIAQATSLADERGALDVLSRRLVANVDLIKALGGGWDAAMLEPEEEQQAVVGNSEVKNTDE